MAVHEAPRVWTDRTGFPGARLENEHRFESSPEGGTVVSTRIRLQGPLAGLWDRLVVRAMAEGQAGQT